MDVRWLTAFIDQPTERFDRGTGFWQRVTASTRSDFRGDEQQFATLLPPDGDPYLRVQRTDAAARIHIDLHVDSVAEARAEAERLGATLLADGGHAIMRSPAGLVFCLVSDQGESVRPQPLPSPAPHRLDQVCIDVPAARFDDEAQFWQALTGWELRAGSLAEFAYLVRPPSMPLRLLIQRLGDDDGAPAARAHLDWACGSSVDAVAVEHQRAGAELLEVFPGWTVMRDPAGLEYCLTARDAEAGRRLGP